MTVSQRKPLNLEQELQALRERFAPAVPKPVAGAEEMRQSGDQPMAPGMPAPTAAPAAPVIAPPDFTAPRRQNRVRFRVR